MEENEIPIVFIPRMDRTVTVNVLLQTVIMSTALRSFHEVIFFISSTCIYYPQHTEIN